MPYFVAFFMLPSVALSNSLDFLFIQLRCEAIFAGRHCCFRENFLAPFKFLNLRVSLKADAYAYHICRLWYIG